jgi:hypothetical protein
MRRVVGREDTGVNADRHAGHVTKGNNRGAAPTGGPLLDLQRRVGNRAVGRLIQRRYALQRMFDDNPMRAGELERNSLPDDYAGKSDPEKINAIRTMIGQKPPLVIGEAWRGLGDELGAARSNPDLFAECVKINDDIPDHGPFDPLRAQFAKDVESTALGYLHSNRQLVVGEMERTGVGAEMQGKQPDADNDFAVQDEQRAAVDMERVKKAKADLQRTRLGTQTTYSGPTDVEITHDVLFSPGGPPSLLLHDPTCPTWEQVNEQWIRTLAVEAAVIRQHPSAAFFLGDKGDPGKLKNAADVKEARALISGALMDLGAKIDNAVPLVGDDLTWKDFPPIHGQLLGGAGPGPSGTVWSKPVEKAVAKESISDANVAHLLVTLGVGTLAAAAFILAELATGGLATFFFVAGATVSAGQAAASWDKYADLSKAHEATVDPEMALVTGEQVDSAMIGAILDTVFAFVDLAMAAKGGYTALKGGKAVLEAGKAGAEVGARTLLKGLQAAPNKAELVLRGLAELGPEATQKAAGVSFEELAGMVGRESEQGKRFLEWAAKGRDAISLTTEQLAEKLPNIGKLGADEAGKVLQAANETFGFLGTLRKAKGWAVLKGAGVMDTAAGKAMETWRHGIVRELNEYIAKESENLSKAVRTGTEAAAGDVDVQIIGGAAAQLQQKAEGWLSGRLGTDVGKAKELLDAEIFVDPFRSHLIDIMKGLPGDVTAKISARSAAFEKQMIFGARLQEAEKVGKEAADRVLAEARDAGVEPFREFAKLGPSEQQRVAKQIDAWTVELKEAADEVRRAELIERISKAQAMINASHSDAYVGGAVHVWVTGREGDAAKFAEALGIPVEELMRVPNAQRIVASLNEGKWMDAALRGLDVGGTPEAMAKAISNLGKHGSRSASVLHVPGVAGAAELDSLAKELMRYKTLHAQGELVRSISKGELAQLRFQLGAELGALRKSTSAAVKSLEGELKALQLPAAEMERFQDWVRWEARMSDLAQKADQMVAGYIRTLETAIDVAAAASMPRDDMEPNFQPGAGEPVHAP